MGVKIKGTYKINKERTSGDYLVRFFDYDGTILNEQWVNSGETATAPTVPTHEYLTFVEWNNSLTNIDCDLDIGAIYNTIDNNTYIFIELTTVSTLNVTLYLTKNTNSLLTVDWGDGTTTTSTTTGSITINKSYSNYGNYIVKVDNLNGGNCYLGWAYTITPYGIFGTNYNIIKKVYFGNTTNGNIVGYQLFRNCKNIDYVSLNSSFSAGALLFQDSSVIHINLPIGLSIQQNMLASAYRCRTMTMNKLKSGYNTLNTVINNSYLLKFPNVTATYVSCANNVLIKKIKVYGSPINIYPFTNSYSLSFVDFPSSITGIQNSAFSGCFSLKIIIFRSIIPPTAGTTIFPSLNSISKIYVPDVSLNNYKTATNWIAYADYIYPLSTYIPE